MSDKYHKIPTAWARDPETKYRTLIEGEWATPELRELRDINWVWTEKVDGTNIRVIYRPDVGSSEPAVDFRGRTDNAQLPPHLLKALQQHFTGDRLGIGLKGPCTLYGEGYGPKIQKGGGDYRPDAGFILFDVWAGMWLEQDTVADIAAALEIPLVPILGAGSLANAVTATKMRTYDSRLRKTPPEGLVMRPPVELMDRRGNRIITKIKLKDFPASP